MNLAPVNDSPEDQARIFKGRIATSYFVRIHMSLMLSAVTVSGVLTSKLLLSLGVHSMRLRYPLAVLAAYLVFVGLVRVWIAYVTGSSFSVPDVVDEASDFVPDVRLPRLGGDPARMALDADAAPARGSSGGSWLPKFGFDFDFGDDWALLLVFLALVAAILGAGGYLIWMAPQILPEVAFQAALASGLVRATKRLARSHWVEPLVRSTVAPLLIVMVLACALGWMAHSHCPSAVKLFEAFGCRVALPPQP